MNDDLPTRHPVYGDAKQAPLMDDSSHDAPLTVHTISFEQLDSLCRSFEDQWAAATHAASTRPSIESYLEQVEQNARSTLLRNLLHIEIEHRRSAEEKPAAGEYLARFPQFAPLIQQVFLKSASATMSPGSGADSSAGMISSPEMTTAGPKLHSPGDPSSDPQQNETAAPFTVRRLGDYEIIRELGRGGMGAVYEAVHTQLGNRIALKLLPLVNGARLLQFKREFRALADVHHPHLVSPHSLESDGGYWFVTMDLIEGVDFLRYVRPEGVFDLGRLRSALSQLAVGVMALHRHHIIHRDLKPSNVMVSHEGKVAILDFGLVFEQAQSWSEKGTAGTPRYMAPEQAAGETLTGAADWYAVGTMLYEALSGRPPFNGSIRQILEAKQYYDPLPLTVASEDPTDQSDPTDRSDLSDLAMRLLDRRPSHRPDALEIAKMVSAPASQANSQSAGVSANPALAGPVLVGRDQQLAQLEDAYQTLQSSRRPLTVFVTGRSGEGKSALCEHFLQPLETQQAQTTVLSGRCYDRESVPFKALDSLIDALSTHLRRLPEVEAALLMPRDIAVLAHVFPVLGRVPVVQRAPQARRSDLDETQVRRRAFAALRELLRCMSDRRPVVLFCDDLHWGDADSAEVLFEILRPPEAPGVLFLGTYRSDEAESSPFLRRWQELQYKHGISLERRDVAVSPLSVDQCAELLISLLGDDSPTIRRRAVEFAQQTGGNPFLLIELAGCFDPQTGAFRARQIHEVVRHKLDRLPREAIPLLDVVAVSGQALSWEEASKAAGLAAEAVSTLTLMRKERLLRMIGSKGNEQVDTYHDKIRQAVLDEMAPPSRGRLHLSLAGVIESLAGVTDEPTEQHNDRVYDLAYHFDASGQSEKARRYALLAAQQARRQFALEVAVQHYAIARRHSDASDTATHYQIAEGCGEALVLLGRYDQAEQVLDGAMELTNDPQGKSQVELLQGEVALKQGAIIRSVQLLESGLRRLGNRTPQTTLGLTASMTREVMVQGLHTMLPFRLHKKPPDPRRLLSIRLLSRLSYAGWFHNNFKGTLAGLTAMNRSEEIPPTPQLAFSYAMTVMSGWTSWGLKYAEKSRELRRRAGDVWGLGHTACYKGIGLYSLGRYEDGLALLTEAMDVFQKTGDPWERHVAQYFAACCHYGLGDLQEAIEQAQACFHGSVREGQDVTIYGSLLHWTRAARGELPFEELKSCFPLREENILAQCLVSMAEGHWRLYQGQAAEAVKLFEYAWRSAWKNLVVNFQTIPALPCLVTALRLHSESLQGPSPAESARLFKRALRLAKWAARITRFYFPDHPHALRELSLLLSAQGKRRRATGVAKRSIAAAQRMKAKDEHVQSQAVLIALTDRGERET